MKLTPLEVKQKKFQNGFRGYDVQEVEEFLLIVSEEMEELARENNELKNKVAQSDETLTEYRNREKTLKETLVTAQQMAEDVKKVAEREAKAILSSAELEGERLMYEATRRREALVSEIHDLKRQKVQFESTLRNAIEVHLKMMDALKEQEDEETKENLTFLRRKEAESSNDDESDERALKES